MKDKLYDFGEWLFDRNIVKYHIKVIALIGIPSFILSIYVFGYQSGLIFGVILDIALVGILAYITV